MANKSANLLSGLSNAKTRSFVILIGAIVIIGIGVAISRGRHKNEDILSKQGTQALAVPSAIKSTPGNAVPEKYRDLQIQENAHRAQEATKEKSSSIPTIFGAVAEGPTKDSSDSLALENALKNQQGGGKLALGQTETGGFGVGAGFGKSEREKEREAQEARLKEQRDRLEKQRLDAERAKELERQRQLALQQQKEYEAAVQKIAGQMKNYATGAYNDWTKISTQIYVQGELAEKERKKGGLVEVFHEENFVTSTDGTKRRTGPTKPVKQKVFIKAGTVLFGTLDTAINSDEQGPILATVISGKYQGAKLIGAFTHQTQQEAVILTFTQMSVPKRAKSFSVSVAAIDPDTARTALATDYDRHLFQRYGSLFAASLIQGYGQAITQQGTTTVSPLTGTTTTTTPPLDNKDKLFAALGETGKQWAQAIKPYFTTPYTVTVDQGTSIGLLFLNDVDVSDDEG